MVTALPEALLQIFMLLLLMMMIVMTTQFVVEMM